MGKLEVVNEEIGGGGGGAGEGRQERREERRGKERGLSMILSTKYELTINYRKSPKQSKCSDRD